MNRAIDLGVWLVCCLILTLVFKWANIEHSGYVAGAIMICTTYYARVERKLNG